MTKHRDGTSEKQATEDAAIEKLIAFLKDSRGISYRVSDRDVVVNPVTGTNFDFELTGQDPAWPKVAVDVCQLFDDEGGAEAERRKGYYWGAMKTALAAAGVGSWAVSIPGTTAPPKREATKLARADAATIKKAIDASPDAPEVQEGRFRAFPIDGLQAPALSTHGEARWVDGPGAARPQLERLLAKKNGQLAVEGCERVVVVVNQSWFIDPDDVVRAAATIDSSGLANIDKVFITDRRDRLGLVYDRKVRDSFDPTCPTPPEADPALLNQWVSARVAARDPNAIRLIRRRTDENGSMGWLPNRYTRAQVVHHIAKSVVEGDLELGLWALRVAIADVDPPLTNYPDDPDGRWNSHERVLRHEDGHGITTVRGAVCWLAQKLVVESGGEHIEELLGAVERLARDENAAVRAQAVIPLIELAIRCRCFADDGTPLYPPEVSHRIRSLTFEMLRASAALPRVLDRLSHALRLIVDLSEGEAAEVIDTLLPQVDNEGLESVLWILVVCAEYRESTAEAPFNSAPFKSRLVDAIANGPPALRATLSFQMRQQFEHDIEGARRLFPYLQLLARTRDSGGIHHVLEIAQRVFEVETNEAFEELALETVASVIENEDRTLAMLSAFLVPPVLEALAARGRWPTVLQLVRMVTGARPALARDRSLLELLRKAPPSHAEEAAELSRAIEATQ